MNDWRGRSEPFGEIQTYHQSLPANPRQSIILILDLNFCHPQRMMENLCGQQFVQTGGGFQGADQGNGKTLRTEDVSGRGADFSCRDFTQTFFDL